MKKIDDKLAIDVEAMTKALLATKMPRKVFKMPCTNAQAFALLLSAYKAEVIHRGREFAYDDATKENIKALADYLTGDSKKFGFMLLGNYGNGKTTLLYAFQNLLNYFARNDYIDREFGMRIVDAKEVIAIARDETYKQMEIVKKSPMLAIEDLGRENTEILDYGNGYSPVIDILEYRYKEQLFTAFTSNLTLEMLTAKYGKRVADRLREMFTTIVFKNVSYR